MAKIRFYQLKSTLAKGGKAVVMLDFPYGTAFRVRKSTGVQMSLETFKKVYHTQKGLNPMMAHTFEYQVFKKMENAIIEVVQQAKLHKKPITAVLIQQALEEEEVPNHQPKSFQDIITEYLEVSQMSKSSKSMFTYKRTTELLLEFAEKKKIALSFDSINLDFFDKFIGYLSQKPNENANAKTKVGFLNDTLNKFIDNFKLFMKWSMERGYHQNQEFLKFKTAKSQKRSKNTDIIVLTEIELKNLKDLDLSNNKRLEQVRDLFVFCVHTGQRWSDIERFESSQVQGEDWIFIAQKTRKKTEVPLVGFGKPAYFILEKYNFKLPLLSPQRFNDYLKEVAKLAGIDTEIVITRFAGTSKIQISKPKYEFISAHTARRTCVTLLLSKGIAPNIIMKLTGHTDIATLMKYINIYNQDLKSAFLGIES
jgi:integrase